MTLRDEIAIRNSPATVWAAISDPSLMPHNGLPESPARVRRHRGIDRRAMMYNHDVYAEEVCHGSYADLPDRG
jgi:hypothetical protein